MDKTKSKDLFGWGFLLWLIGYILGFVFFMFVPASMIGWYIMPIGLVITALVLSKNIKSTDFKYYFLIALSWTAIAIAFDFIFILKMLKPADGYYKPDVFLYYCLTFLLPLLFGLSKSKGKK